MKKVRVRIAPSPTGDPHVGTAYIALFNYIFAQQHGGDFILRIEDTDQVRAKPASEQLIYSSLKWLGLDWQEGPDRGGPYGPYRQSERLSIYQKYVQDLLGAHNAYHCFCSKDRLEEMRRQQRLQGLPPRYDSFCRSLSHEEVEKKKSAGLPFVVRLKIPDDEFTTFQDEIRGEIRFENHRIDDQVLMKSDGYPTYHLANVVDDHLMEITHVIRAEEWIPSTPKHVILYRAFGWEAPKWAHLPLLRNADKTKISKRKNPVAITYYRGAGYLPEAFLNFLALMGWNPGHDIEIFDLLMMKDRFALKDFNLGDPIFDVTKLNWMNHQYLQKIDDKRFASLLREQFFSEAYLKKIKPLVIERIHKLDEFITQNAFFFQGSLDYKDLPLVPKGVEASVLATVMTGLLEKLDDLYEWNVASLTEVIEGEKSRSGLKPRDFFMPLRFAITGRKDSPPLMETMEVLGRELVRMRIKSMINYLSAHT